MTQIAKRVVCAILLAVVFVADAVYFETEGSSSLTQQADLKPGFKVGTKTYDTAGKWTGCTSGSPKNCVMISTVVGDAFLSLEGVRTSRDDNSR